MRARSRLVMIMVALAFGGGFLTAGAGTGCANYLVETTLSAADFCFIFDCQQGFFGGTVDPCPPVGGSTGEAFLTPPTGPVFADCPELQQ